MQDWTQRYVISWDLVLPSNSQDIPPTDYIPSRHRCIGLPPILGKPYIRPILMKKWSYSHKILHPHLLNPEEYHHKVLIFKDWSQLRSERKEEASSGAKDLVKIIVINWYGSVLSQMSVVRTLSVFPLYKSHVNICMVYGCLLSYDFFFLGQNAARVTAHRSVLRFEDWKLDNSVIIWKDS